MKQEQMKPQAFINVSNMTQTVSAQAYVKKTTKRRILDKTYVTYFKVEDRSVVRFVRLTNVIAENKFMNNTGQSVCAAEIFPDSI